MHQKAIEQIKRVILDNKETLSNFYFWNKEEGDRWQEEELGRIAKELLATQEKND